MHRDPLFPVDDPAGDIAAIESLERTLDILSDDQVERPDASARTSSPLAGTAVALRALDDARPPDPSFVAHLEEQLMSTIAVHPRRPRTSPQPPNRAWRPPGPRFEVRRPHPATSRRRGLIEFVSLAALIAVLFGQTLGFGGGFAFWRQSPVNTPTPGQPIVAQGNESTPTDASPQAGVSDDVAVERGNPGRTGEYDTAGPVDQPALLWRYNDPNGDPMDVLEPIVVEDTIHFSILRGFSYALTDFSLPEGSGGFGSWLYTSSYRVNVAVGNGLVYAASLHPGELSSTEATDFPALVAYDYETKAVRWRAEVDFAKGSSPVLAGDTLIVLGDDALIALDALTGEERWRAPIATIDDGIQPATLRNPAVEGETVVVNELVPGTMETGGPFGTLRAFDVATGVERWFVASDGGYFGPVSIAGGIVYADELIYGDSDVGGRRWALDAATGEAIWTFPGEDQKTLAPWSAGSSPVVDAISVYDFEVVIPGVTSTLIARDRQTGESTWQRELDASPGSQLSLADGVLYYALSDGAVYAVDATSGDELWRVDTGDAGRGTPIPADGYLVIASRTAVYAFGPATDPASAASDVSGLPACVSPRSVSETPPTGEPALSLVGLEDNPLGFGIPTGGRMLLTDVPEGVAAGDAAVAGIYTTLSAMTACARPGSELELAGFYSDDYFRRFNQIEGRPGSTPTAYSGLFPVASIAVGDLGAPYTLPDGRVAILAFDPLGDRGTLLVFVEQDDAWLIDEMVEVGRDPEVWRQG